MSDLEQRITILESKLDQLVSTMDSTNAEIMAILTKMVEIQADQKAILDKLSHLAAIEEQQDITTAEAAAKTLTGPALDAFLREKARQDRKMDRGATAKKQTNKERRA